MKISKKTILCAALAVTIVTFTIGGLFTLWWFSVPNAQLLVNAAGNDDLDKVKQLVAKGTDPNAQEPGMLGDTPLVASTLAEGTNVFFFLLSAGADIYPRDQKGKPPPMMSVSPRYF